MEAWLIEKGNVHVLAFFPVVAISTNFSTKILRYKASEKIQDNQKYYPLVR
jgi:hypothetical protein